jgi:hypothetical protein
MRQSVKCRRPSIGSFFLFSLPIEMAISRQTLEVVEDRFNLRIDFPVCDKMLFLGFFLYGFHGYWNTHVCNGSILVWKKEM